jgi:ankyrin repeat protein
MGAVAFLIFILIIIFLILLSIFSITFSIIKIIENVKKRKKYILYIFLPIVSIIPFILFFIYCISTFSNFDNENKGLIIYAIEKNDINKIKDLIRKGENVNKCSSYSNMSPLYLAVSKKRYNIVKLLLDNNADVNINNEDYSAGDPLIIAAIKNKDYSMIELLLDKGSNTIIKKNGTILHYAILYGCFKYKINVNLKNKDGETALHYIVKYNNNLLYKILYGFHNKIDTENFKLLIKQGAEINEKDNQGKAVIDYLNENKKNNLLNYHEK